MSRMSGRKNGKISSRANIAHKTEKQVISKMKNALVNYCFSLLNAQICNVAVTVLAAVV